MDDVLYKIPTSQQRYRRGAIPGQHEQAQAIIDNMGRSGTYRPRASTQSRSRPRPADHTTNLRPARLPAPDTDDDDRAPSTRSGKATRRDSYQQDQRRQGIHPLFYIGVGLVTALILWAIAVQLWAMLFVNVFYRWDHGAAHVTALHGVYGHNHDNQAHQTRLEAFVDNGRVEIAELPGGDPTKARIFIGPELASIAGWQGDPNAAVIDMQDQTQQDGKVNVVVTVYGPVFGANFKPESVGLKLTNSGDSFKLGGQ